MLGKQATVRVLIASAKMEVHEALESIAPYDAIEAMTTRGVYHALPNTQLAVVEVETLIEEEVTRDTLVEVLNRSRVPWATPESFLADPSTWRAHALAASGDFRSFPPATAVLTSYSGGVGKTTLSLDAAVLFAARTKLPTALIEFPHGPSALRVITSAHDGAGFVDVVHNEHAKLPTWRGVTLVSVNYNDVGGLLQADDVIQCFKRIQAAHILTMVDSEFPHPWLEAVAPLVGMYVIVGAPRADAWNNAATLKQVMERTPDLYHHSQIVFNMVDGWGDRLTQLGLDRLMDLPRVKNPERLDGRLGTQLLNAIYPYWSQAMTANRRAA
jgi:hypothetical protein